MAYLKENNKYLKETSLPKEFYIVDKKEIGVGKFRHKIGISIVKFQIKNYLAI